MTLPSSITQQSYTFDRGDNVQFLPMRTLDPMDKEEIVEFSPIVVCDPIVNCNVLSLDSFGSNNASLEIGTTVGRITTPS
jgi:hypothetical protein